MNFKEKKFIIAEILACITFVLSFICVLTARQVFAFGPSWLPSLWHLYWIKTILAIVGLFYFFASRASFTSYISFSTQILLWFSLPIINFIFTMPFDLLFSGNLQALRIAGLNADASYMQKSLFESRILTQILWSVPLFLVAIDLLRKLIKKIKGVVILSISIFLFLNFASCLFAAIIDGDGWKDIRAYRPYPVLFLHGFAQGGPQTWTGAKVDEILSPYYSKYYTGYNTDPTILPSTRYPYLEINDFGSSLIDRNSSIDTYKIGDRYVQTGDRRPGDTGWSDKVNSAVETLRQHYINKDGATQKIILVDHSMGGLAARKYLGSDSYATQKIEKNIMIGTPNIGSIWATNAVILNRNRRWGIFIPGSGWISSSMIDILDNALELRILADIDGDAVWDMDSTSLGSGFINELNSGYSVPIDHFVIAGKHWSAFNVSDGVVSLDSQLGANVLGLRDFVTISALHWDEPAVSVQGDNPLLKFLDSTKPEFEITYPGLGTTEIYESSIHIQGKVYKEYLPADTELIITIIRQEDGYTPSPQNSLLEPSNLWAPNNSDSPVAEFDELINFPGSGTYKISCQIKNPAGITSDVKDIFVKVTIFSGTNIIVHCHNPEGKEIASIEGMDNPWWGIKIKIYDGDKLIEYGAHDAKTHNRPIAISPGAHAIKAEFNGMTEEQTVALSQNETKVIIFTFDRTEITTVSPSFSVSRSISGSGHHQGGGRLEYITLLKDGDSPNILQYRCYLGTTGGLDFTWEVDASYELSGWGFQYESYAHVYVISSVWGEYEPSTIGEAQVSVPCNFSIPESQEFTYWFSQGTYSSLADFSSMYGPAIYANSYDVIAPVRYGSFGYGINLLRADKPYVNIRFSFYHQWGWFNLYEGNVEHTDNQWWGPTILSNFKISSVPYDLTGYAI